VFTLLVSFMVIVRPTHGYHGLAVDLPASSYAVQQRYALRENAMRLAMTRDGTVHFRNYKTVPEQLPEAIREAVKQGAERKVYLQIDSRARYGDSEAMLDRIREAGLSRYLRDCGEAL